MKTSSALALGKMQPCSVQVVRIARKLASRALFPTFFAKKVQKHQRRRFQKQRRKSMLPFPNLRSGSKLPFCFRAKTLSSHEVCKLLADTSSQPRGAIARLRNELGEFSSSIHPQKRGPRE